MSGLVTGLQNRLQRFESASDLKKPFYKHLWRGFLFFTPLFTPLSHSRFKRVENFLH